MKKQIKQKKESEIEDNRIIAKVWEHGKRKRSPSKRRNQRC